MGRCYSSTVVNAPADTVWEALADFHDLSWARGVITDVAKVGDPDGRTPGARRVLNGAFHETLLAHDDAGRTLSYSIDDGPGPVARDGVREYVGTVTVRPVTDANTAFVEWASRFESVDDAAVAGFCNPIYRALLAALKDRFR